MFVFGFINSFTFVFLFSISVLVTLKSMIIFVDIIYLRVRFILFIYRFLDLYVKWSDHNSDLTIQTNVLNNVFSQMNCLWMFCLPLYDIYFQRILYKMYRYNIYMGYPCKCDIHNDYHTRNDLCLAVCMKVFRKCI